MIQMRQGCFRGKAVNTEMLKMCLRGRYRFPLDYVIISKKWDLLG